MSFGIERILAVTGFVGGFSDSGVLRYLGEWRIVGIARMNVFRIACES